MPWPFSPTSGLGLERRSSVSQCLSAGTCFPDRIAEAVDLATPQAPIIRDKGTFCSPGSTDSWYHLGSPLSLGWASLQALLSPLLFEIALPVLLRVEKS